MSPRPHPRSFYESLPAVRGAERFDTLYEHHGVKIERIVSSGTQSAQSYCQSQDEWVLLLRGQAEMRIDGEPITIHEGEFIRLPADVPHEVLSTSDNALWLAVHVEPR
jgi:cupin 2 domain-containing protein